MKARTVPGDVLPSARFRRRLALIVISLAGLVAFLVYLRIDPLQPIRDFHFVVNLAGEMLPPNFNLLWTKQGLWISLLQTLAMAFLGTVVGGSIAIVLALLAAGNTSPSRFVRLLVRTLLAAERCTPNIVVLLVLLIAVGIGPFAAMLSLCIGSIGMFGKLFADAIEHVDPLPGEAVAAAGASRLQVIRYAILPQITPSIAANVFYAFDVNLRLAIALGVLGGGGIGFELHVARSVLRYRDMLACLILVMILINLTERIADVWRKRLFLGETELP
jgi:phosphonate transport system permease protein